MHELITTWRNFSIDIGPYILPGDEVLQQDTNRYCHIINWRHYIGDSNFGAPGDKRFHLGLLPQPYKGNIESASIYLLMLNPGLRPHDYFGEYEVPEYREAIINNLKQNYVDGEKSFFNLEPRFSWRDSYWYDKLTKLIAEFATRVDISYGESREFFQKKIAVIELVPYHSINFSMPKGILNELRSVKLVRSYVNEVLVPKAKKGQCLIIIMRSAKEWQLQKRVCKQIIIYKNSEARGAHLTPKSRGGKVILKFFEGIWQ